MANVSFISLVSFKPFLNGTGSLKNTLNSRVEAPVAENGFTILLKWLQRNMYLHKSKDDTFACRLLLYLNKLIIGFNVVVD